MEKEKVGKKRKVGQGRFYNTWIHVLMFLCAMACILPFVLVLAISLTDEKSLIVEGYRFFPKAFSLDAYKYLFTTPITIIRAYGITILITAAGTVLSLAMTSMLAYTMSRKNYPYRRILSIYVLLTMLFNGGLTPWYLVYTQIFNVKDSLLALLIPNMLVSGFNVIVMRTFFSNSVSDSLIDAAAIDGAGEFKIYWKIILPLSKPVLAAIAFMTVLGYWNNWYNSMVFINDSAKFSVQYLMTRTLLNMQALKSAMMMGTMSPEMIKALSDLPSNGVRMAMAVVGVGPMLFLFPFAQKYFVSGLTLGSVKG